MKFSLRLFTSKLLLAAVLTVGLASVSGFESFAANTKETKEPTDPAYKNAVSLYQKASYAEALTEFEKLTNSKDVGELSRYYKALCLQQQKQIKAAHEEYMYLYSNAQDKTIRYKAWLQLRSLQPAAAKTQKTAVATSKSKDGPGASDVWITPGEGYGRSGPAASSQVSVTIIPTSCGRRRR